MSGGSYYVPDQSRFPIFMAFSLFVLVMGASSTINNLDNPESNSVYQNLWHWQMTPRSSAVNNIPASAYLLLITSQRLYIGKTPNFFFWISGPTVRCYASMSSKPIRPIRHTYSATLRFPKGGHGRTLNIAISEGGLGYLSRQLFRQQ